jgi:hypothetical protein
MPILTRPEFGPRTALAYVTVGALLDVWTIVWYFTHEESRTSTTHFWVIGLVLTGITLIVLGLYLGRLGRAARRAELPPPEAIRSEIEIQKTAAATTGNPVNPAPVPTPSPVSGTIQTSVPTYVN